MIALNNISKRIKNKDILVQVAYEFEPGKIYGLYGRNGSGKTMLLRAIAGLISLDDGEITIDDKTLHKDMDFPESVGVIIEHTNLLPQYDAFTNLKLLSKIKKVATEEDIRNAILAVGLDPDCKDRVRTYSLGMKQRLAIAQAIFEDPDILLLDEPTNALDEKSIDMVRGILLQKKAEGKTIILASHNKEDLDILSDVTIKMDAGQLVVA
ncbi:ATP-binding cassette domain-containing protein [Agathobacter ruminis]|uniref:Multidrug ABC transporter ATP-binding protein n=1 Tax=Agathobacter ruminis TaxID=1712665 RepID=A0A2G3E534_9FIRM|nr:ABC transporter ATP-binding protein [Agathobacter ruminis]MDC7301162.1 ABC transporter ATP-binding protein [Agathobacter ruminis]PHU38379.1 multidrug ABC transporter ATP-binding protein [Agathobacter ruminis]